MHIDQSSSLKYASLPIKLHPSGPEPVNVREYEKFAEKTLPLNAWSYYSSGANDMVTLRENRAAYNR